jgi:hypothetical protein
LIFTINIRAPITIGKANTTANISTYNGGMYRRQQIIKEADGFMPCPIGRIIIEKNEGIIIFGNVKNVSPIEISKTMEGAGQELTDQGQNNDAASTMTTSSSPRSGHIRKRQRQSERLFK